MAEISKRIPSLDVSFPPCKGSVNKKGNLATWDTRNLPIGGFNLGKCSSPSYPSPIDRIRSGKQERALALGWTGWRDSSFEGNQSFPRISRPKLRKEDIYPDTLHKIRMDRIRGDGLNSCSFSAGRSRGSLSTSRRGSRLSQAATDLGSNIRSLKGFSDSAWSFSNSFVSALGGASSSYPITTMNPNKAVFTIDSKTSQILVVNGMACGLLGFSPEELCVMRIDQLLNERHKMQITALAEEQLDTKEGSMVVLSGKVVEMLTKDGNVVPVSLWLRKLETESRCLAVAEPVERRVARLVMDRAGCIMSADAETALIFQYEEEELEGADIATLIPAIKLPGNEAVITKDVKKQKATGRTREGGTFPLCLRMAEEPVDDKDMDNNANSVLYSVVIWVFANMSGLVVLTDDGTIESCNHHFTHMMFGYPQSELLGQKITSIIPNFCEDMEYLGDTTTTLPQFDLNKPEEDDNSNYDSAVENMDPDKSRSSSVLVDSEYSTPASRECSKWSRPDSDGIEILKIGDMPHASSENKDRENGNDSLACVEEIVDSLNRLNFGMNFESPGDRHPFTTTTKHRSKMTICIPGQLPSNTIHSGSSSDARAIPPVTLDLPCGDAVTAVLADDDNGELTPVVSPHMNFVEEDDQFETASDDEDSIEVLASDQGGDLADDKVDLDLDGLVSPIPCINTPELTRQLDECVGGSPSVRCLNGADSVENSFNSSGKVSSASVEAIDRRSSLSESVLARCEEQGPGHHSHALDDECLERPLDMLFTSSPAVGKRLLKRVLSRDVDSKADAAEKQFPDGSFIGFGRHKDGSNLDIVYRVRGVVLSSGRVVYCVWVSRDPEEVAEGGRAGGGNLTLTSSFNSTIDNSLGQAIRSCAQSNVPASAGNRSGSVSVLSQCEDEQTSGEYGEHYSTLQQIGKGAFGYVKMAFRNEDGLLVITKFIQKQKVHQQSWVDDPTLGRKVPLEISLLTTLKHPNIVQVLDVFENAKFFQLVMEKHGAGMDLFEFIDRKPYLDESLNSYIFRQIVSAVDYLHSLNILHRDIKDENVIINERFHAKLIDFGSATFMSEGRLFSTFYGTVEYCSPEVLAGNKYEGPELEMWSLGVTLYVMTFGENPFFDVEEIMKAELHPPGKVSEELTRLLHWMLAKDPKERCRVPQLVAHPWITQDVDMSGYCFQDVVSCHPQEAHPPVFYADYRCDSANDSLSQQFPITESSSALLSNNDDTNDRTVGSSNSLGSLTTVENFETEDDLPGGSVRVAEVFGAWSAPTPLPEGLQFWRDVGLDDVETKQNIPEEVTIDEHVKKSVGKVTHSLEEVEDLVDLTSGLSLEPESAIAVEEDDDWDPDEFFYEQDSFS
ncbi:hypothetical protein R5R35_005350 [Gryllus longicercus]|uniref:Protein kinase domain-containing protein n=1 Tax=Gryllus longicercus TaxID=2509291 RepID=A0AAN9VDD5_9ORTH